MRNGRYKHRVVFLEPIEGEDASGSQTVTYAPSVRAWCAVEPVESAKGDENLVADQPLALLRTQILTRYGPHTGRISEKWRAQHRGVTYNLVEVVNVKYADRDLRIVATSGAING